MFKLEIHPGFQDLEIEKAKTYLSSATAITVVEDLKDEISVLNVLHGIVVGDDTCKFEIDGIAISSSIMKSSHQNTRFITKVEYYYVSSEPVDFAKLTVAE
tara:strand:+ start:4341 stop:4643 length:303 start_codon:yes stop_codon:yes gene_type:complete